MATTVAAWTVAVPVLDIDLAVRQSPQTVREVGHLAVTLASLAAGLAGWGWVLRLR